MKKDKQKLDAKIIAIISKLGITSSSEVVSHVMEKMPEIEEPYIRGVIWTLLNEGRLEHTLERDLTVPNREYHKPSINNSYTLEVLALDTIYLLYNDCLNSEQQQKVLDAFYRCAVVFQESMDQVDDSLAKIIQTPEFKEDCKLLLEHYLKPIPEYKPEE